jgi:hypothetical protein
MASHTRFLTVPRADVGWTKQSDGTWTPPAA